MSCCGRQRAAMAGQGASGAEVSETVWLSYAGVRPILVKGAATGQVYRFAPGNWLRVHARDVPSMHAIPGLRRRDTSV